MGPRLLSGPSPSAHLLPLKDTQQLFQTFTPSSLQCHLLPSHSWQMVWPPTAEKKIEAISLVHTLLPTSPPLSRAPHTHLYAASTAFYLQSEDSSKANVFVFSVPNLLNTLL